LAVLPFGSVFGSVFGSFGLVEHLVKIWFFWLIWFGQTFGSNLVIWSFG
jgi:hypothetical protein